MPSKDSVIVGGMDWGRADPFSCHLTEVKRVDYNGKRFFRSKVFLETYGTDRDPSEWAKIIEDRMKFYGITFKDIAWIRGDTQMWAPGLDAKALDIYTQFVQANEGFRALKPANKDRIGGWVNLHRWLSIAPDGLPYLQFSADCVNAIRTIPELIHDESKVEDLDSTGEDHSADDIRYLHMALKWIDGMAQVGAMIHPNLVKSPTRFAPQFVSGKQLGMDLDSWATPAISERANDRDVGGVRRQ